MRKSISILLTLLLLATAPLTALAAAGPKISLEQAVLIAKQAFPVPEALTEFESNYSSYGDRPRWDLSWSPAAGSTVGGSLNVTVDASSGDILSMYSWGDDETPKSALPKYSRAEAQQAAADLAARIQPLFSETRLVTSDDERFWGGPVLEYGFVYERVVNGYSYPANNIQIRVNANTLQVESYGFNWDRDILFPQPGRIIEPDQAKAAFLTKAAPRLIYFRPNPENNKDRPIKLVYDLDRVTTYVVDAETGQVRLGTSHWYDPMGFGGNAKDEAMKALAPRLSPAEQAEVDELASLLTQEEAIEKVRALFKIPTKMKLQRAYLTKGWEYTQQRQWSFSWDLTEKDKGGESISASVDARTGDLMKYYRYSWSTDGDKKPVIKYKKDKAQKIAADFIAKHQSERLADCRLEEIEPDEIVILREKEEPRSYSFNWIRYVNDVAFPQQGFRLEVSAETGEITSYNMTWSDEVFPDLEGILTQQAAETLVLERSPLVIEYLPVPIMDTDLSEPDTAVGLCYHVRAQDVPGRLLDAMSGIYLDYQANPLPDRELAAFADLEGHPEADSVALLQRKGIVQGSPDGCFHPDEAITEPAYLVMLLRTTGYQPRAQVEDGPWYKQYEDQARRRGILKAEESIDSAMAITRERVAVWTVRALNQEPVAALQGIWNVPAKDAAGIQFPGHVALYLGQNLDPDRQAAFRAEETLGRAQAARGMILFLSQERY